MRKPREVFFFFDLPEEQRNKALASAAKKLRTIDKDLRAKVDRINAEDARERRPRKAHFGAPDLMSRDLIEFEGGIDLDDGYYRLVVKTKLGALEIFNGQRFETPSLEFVSKQAHLTRQMTEWPTYKVRNGKGGTKRKLIHWKAAGTAEVALVLIRENKDRTFYLDWPSSQNGVPDTRWSFVRRFSPSARGDDWMMVRPQRISKTSDEELPASPPPKKRRVRPPKRNEAKVQAMTRERVKCEKCGRSIFPHPTGRCLPCQGD